MEIAIKIIKYWIELCTKALHEGPSKTLLKLHESICGIYQKGDKNDTN